MNQLLIFIIGLILGGTAVWFWSGWHARKHSNILENVGMSEKKNQPGADKLEEFNEEREKEREANKQKILNLLEKKGELVNDDVQGLLSVSDATATRYLDELEKDGKIKQVGKTGHYTHYQKV